MIEVVSSRSLPTLREIEAAEQVLGGVRFPDDYRLWLLENNGFEGWFGDVFLMLYSLADVVGITQAAEAEERLPGFVAVGSDGSRENVAFDFRSSPPRVVLLDLTAEGWDEARPQAVSFSEFMRQRQHGEGFVWDPSDG